ncbi:MAG: HAD family hydrolase [Firmicutes bacterium]|nr:HAD family hydrolase [Bacillota bacterium]
MKYKGIFFDLDGTLLALDMDRFLEQYLRGLTGKVARHVPPEHFVKSLMAATKDMQTNDGRGTNEQVFAQSFFAKVDSQPEQLMPLFDDFYANEYKALGDGIEPLPSARKAVELALQHGAKVVVATNPLFPRIAVETRLHWAGLADMPFDHITSYENSSFCKPNPAYYQEILDKFNLQGKDCLMVGNDPLEDLAASELDFDTFLLEDHMIERNSKYQPTWRGSWDQLLEILE